MLMVVIPNRLQPARDPYQRHTFLERVGVPRFRRTARERALRLRSGSHWTDPAGGPFPASGACASASGAV